MTDSYAPPLAKDGLAPAVTLVRMPDGRWAARPPGRLHMMEVRLHEKTKRVHLVAPYSLVDFTTMERMVVDLARPENQAPLLGIAGAPANFRIVEADRDSPTVTTLRLHWEDDVDTVEVVSPRVAALLGFTY